MALTAGTRLGPYEITAQIGVGGMGWCIGVWATARTFAPNEHRPLMSCPNLTRGGLQP